MNLRDLRYLVALADTRHFGKAAERSFVSQPTLSGRIAISSRSLQNRRIIDRAFREANSVPIPRLETNSVINLCANVRLMGLASIIPEYFLDVLGPISDVRAVPLTDPLVEHNVGLVAVDRDPISPLVLAAFECAKETEPPVKSRRK